MTSWDFFDTLCGRTCGEPWRLFDLVAGEEYRRLRQEAERQSDKTWPGIFRTLAEITGWGRDRVAELQAREWDLEVRSAFPVAANVRRVQGDDIIVSDTYLSEGQVRELATRIGIPKSTAIHTSWDAKWSGRWWSDPRRPSSDVHVGDNHRSDIAKAKSAGVETEHYRAGAMLPDEIKLTASGFWEVAAAMRATRLQNPYVVGSREAAHWDNAAAVNVRFVLLAAALVRQYVEAAKPQRVYFVSRDAILLERAYAALYGGDTGIFHSSRETLRRPSRDFLTYVKKLASGTLFVDLHGTGKSVRQFCTETGIDLAYVFVCGQKRLVSQFPSLATLRGINAGTAVEVMNYHHEGRVVDVVGGKPVRADLEYDRSIVDVHRAATLCGIAAACRPPVGVTSEDVAAAVEAIARSVPRDLIRQHQVEHRQGVDSSGQGRGPAVRGGPARRIR